jgi:hypothetical protein
VQADYVVELGSDDEVLELPWAAGDQGVQYYDLKRLPELLNQVPEATRLPELREFLAAINSPSGIFESAKCDAWSSSEMNPEERIFGAAIKFGCYVDFVFTEHSRRFSLADHENLAKSLTELLKRAPEIPAAAEFMIRRCYFRADPQNTEAGFYVTSYVFGYGSDEDHAKTQWAIGLKLVGNALRQRAKDFRPG